MKKFVDKIDMSSTATISEGDRVVSTSFTLFNLYDTNTFATFAYSALEKVWTVVVKSGCIEVDGEIVSTRSVLRNECKIAFDTMAIYFRNARVGVGISQRLVEKFLKTQDLVMSEADVLRSTMGADSRTGVAQSTEEMCGDGSTGLRPSMVLECMRRNALFIEKREGWSMDYKCYIDFLEGQRDPLSNAIKYELEHATHGSPPTFNLKYIWNDAYFSDSGIGETLLSSGANGDNYKAMTSWPYSSKYGFRRNARFDAGTGEQGGSGSYSHRGANCKEPKPESSYVFEPSLSEPTNYTTGIVEQNSEEPFERLGEEFLNQFERPFLHQENHGKKSGVRPTGKEQIGLANFTTTNLDTTKTSDFNKQIQNNGLRKGTEERENDPSMLQEILEGHETLEKEAPGSSSEKEQGTDPSADSVLYTRQQILQQLSSIFSTFSICSRNREYRRCYSTADGHRYMNGYRLDRSSDRLKDFNSILAPKDNTMGNDIIKKEKMSEKDPEGEHQDSAVACGNESEERPDNGKLQLEDSIEEQKIENTSKSETIICLGIITEGRIGSSSDSMQEEKHNAEKASGVLEKYTKAEQPKENTVIPNVHANKPRIGNLSVPESLPELPQLVPDEKEEPTKRKADLQPVKRYKFNFVIDFAPKVHNLPDFGPQHEASPGAFCSEDHQPASFPLHQRMRTKSSFTSISPHQASQADTSDLDTGSRYLKRRASK